MKKCKDCKKEKHQSEFYGVQGECKECTKVRVSVNYFKNVDYYKEYELKRNKQTKRKQDKARYLKEHRARNPEKNKARQMVNRALRNGTLKKKKCMLCKSPKTEAHHPDYSKPLQVMWLCREHHREIEAQKLLIAL